MGDECYYAEFHSNLIVLLHAILNAIVLSIKGRRAYYAKM
jgi:hypothetical protein